MNSYLHCKQQWQMKLLQYFDKMCQDHFFSTEAEDAVCLWCHIALSLSPSTAFLFVLNPSQIYCSFFSTGKLDLYHLLVSSCVPMKHSTFSSSCQYFRSYFSNRHSYLHVHLCAHLCHKLYKSRIGYILLRTSNFSSVFHLHLSFLVQSFKETLQYCDEWRKFTSAIQSFSHSVNSGGGGS